MKLDAIVVYTLIVLSPLSAFSQSALLKHGDNGVGILGGLGVNKDGLAVLGTAVGTIYGRFDFSVELAQEVFDGYKNAPPVTSFGFEVFPLREGFPKGFPVSLSFAYQISDVSAYKFHTYGASLYKRLGESKSSFVQPFAAGFIIDESKNMRGSEKGFAFGFSVASRIGSTTIFSFTPSATKIRNSYSASFVVGFSFYSNAKVVEPPATGTSRF